MWYVSAWLDPTGPSGTRYLTRYAVSADGIEWMKPDLGQQKWEGSRENKLIRCGPEWMRRPNVILDDHEIDSEHRSKMTYVDHPNTEKGPAIMSASSANGLQWKTRGEPWFRKEHNSNLLGWDEPCGSYVLFPRLHLDGHQGVGRSESPDFETWSEVEPLIHPGPTESHLQFKGMAAFPYYGVYIGMLWVFVGSPRKSHAELTFSRDGLHWHRPFPGIPFFDRGPEAAWGCENILPVAPVIHGESIRIYYSGWNLPYTIDAMQRARTGGSRMAL